jgi:5-formyltetrahydrofolate cyclo-ligase
MKPTKADLRRSLKQARLALSPEERQTKSTTIISHLWQAIDWSQVKTLHCFEPIERLGEVDISDFITALRDEHPNIQLFTSRQINKTWEIVALTDGRPVAELQFNVIIVPMLGFDQSLHRIGYGGGYYDQFLATHPTAQKIGVCFDLGKLDHIPAEPHDIPLNTIITETNAYLPLL